MPRILIRSGKSPLTAVSAEASLARNGWGVFGANVGNLLFTSSVHRAVSIPGAEVVSNSLLTELGGVDEAYVHRINDEFDGFVVPLANAFRPSFVTSLQRLTGVIKQLTIPVTVVGVGAQLPTSEGVAAVPENVRQATVDFVSAVLDRSATIGVRGETTREFLMSLGFSDSSIDVIGCPSLFMDGANVSVVKGGEALTAESNIAINITPSVTEFAPFVERYSSEFPRMVYIPQEHHDLALMMWGEKYPGTFDPRMPTRLGHPLYEQNRMRFFLDASTWTKYLGEADFAFGTRIHGNVAALMAGTPAVVVAHDSRTLELARYHDIPHRLVSDLTETTSVADLYAESDFGAFNAGHRPRFDVYRAFLERNGIEHIFTPGNENPAYDQQLRSTAFPGPVQTLAATGETGVEDVAARLRWLRQGAKVDAGRRVDGYRPPFGHTPKATEAAGQKVVNRETSAAVTELVERVALQDQRIEELERIIGQMRDLMPLGALRRLKAALPTIRRTP